jgi:hypothetical protein
MEGLSPGDDAEALMDLHCLYLGQNAFHSRTTYIDVHHHYMHSESTTSPLMKMADIFTRPLSGPEVEAFGFEFGFCPRSLTLEGEYWYQSMKSASPRR